jgi:hypothetical protein
MASRSLQSIDAVNAIMKDFAASKTTVATTVGANYVNVQTLLQKADGDADKMYTVLEYIIISFQLNCN